jgi:MscS family membrane protein
VRWIANHIKNLGFADPEDVRKAARILSLLFIVFAVGRVFPVLQLPILWAKFITTAIAIISAVLWMTLGLVVVRIVTKRFRVLTAATESKMDDQLLPIVRKLLQIGVVIVAAVYILSRLNFNVAALIAGLSIGALALALAAQDTVKNLIGSVMIFIDKPFQIGDFVTVDGQEGTITEVGFRSTRIMLVDTSIVSIPNGNVANITVLNLGVRKMRLMNILIGVTYDTPPEKIEAYIAELKQLIQDHPGVHKEEWKVYFRDMGDFALKIMFRCYIPVFTFDEELRVKEELYLKIMRIAQRLEIEFAFPSQTIYLEK